MTHLTRLSLANRLIVGLATLAIIVFGVLATTSLKQELLPSTQVPTAVVTASYPGASPQIIADDISTPIERSVTGISGVTTVESTSTNGLATITVQWEYGLDTDKLVGNIRNAVDGLAPTLPEQVETNVITGSTDDIPVLLLAVSSDAGLTETGALVQNVAVPDLSAVDGVRSVSVTGQNTQQLSVTLRPADLRRNDLTAQAVTQVVRSQALVTPAGTSYDQSLELAVEVGQSTGTVKAFRGLAVPTADGPIPLSRVADVEVESVQSTSLARADGRPAISLSIVKETDADAVEISDAVSDLLPDLAAKMGNGTAFSTVFDQAPLIEQSIEDLAVEGGLGLAFAVLVILVFLWSLRSTLITAISIPLSLLIAMIGLQLGGYSLNIFTLAALTVAVGRVVDDSIVVLENIKRRDSGHLALTPADIMASVREVAGAVTSSTLTTVAVFLPVAVVSGVVGELFRPFAITVAIALAASLLVSMTIVPVLAFWFLRGGRRRAVVAAGGVAAGALPAAGAGAAVPPTPAEAEAAVVHTAEETKVTRLQRAYLPVLRWGLRHPVVTLAVAALVFVATLGSATLLKTDFLGSVTDQTVLTISQKMPAGTRLAATSEATEKIEAVLAADPAVKAYLTNIGGSIIPGTGSNANTAEITVNLADGYEATTVKPELESQLAELGDAVGELTVANANNGSTTNDITVVVSGENTQDLTAGAARIERELAGVPGLTDVRSNLAEQRKLLKVQVDRDKAAALGFTQAEVGQAVANVLRGTPVGTVTLQGEQRDIVVRSQSADDPTPGDVADIELPVSQLQQQQAQERASDALAAEQDEFSAEQQRKQDDAVADQQAQLREQRSELVDSRSEAADQLADTRDQLADARAQLRRLQANPPRPPQPPAPPAPSAPAGPTARPNPSSSPGPVPPGPVIPPNVVTQEQLAYERQAQQWGQQVAALQAAVGQTEGGIQQLEGSVDQLDESIDRLDEQLAASREQAAETAETRARQQELADAQKALGDVRARPVRVKDVAKVEQVLGPTTITQIEGTPSVTITATPDAADLGALTATIQTRLDAVRDLPPGISVTLGGAAQDQRDAFNQLGLAMLVALVLVFMIMVGTFRSLVQPLILMVSVPFAATGAIAALLITDTPLGVPAMVGLLMLIGIVVTNAIVLIDLINQYRERGEGLQAAVIDGARLRLRPIIMTASATIFALIPMGLGLTGGGAFISQSLAVVVIGGLVSSTVLTLLLVPVLYSLVERRSERRRLRAVEV